MKSLRDEIRTRAGLGMALIIERFLDVSTARKQRQINSNRSYIVILSLSKNLLLFAMKSLRG